MTHECLLRSIQEFQYGLRERFWLLHVRQMGAMGEDSLLRPWDRVGHQVSRVYSRGVIERPDHHQRREVIVSRRSMAGGSSGSNG